MFQSFFKVLNTIKLLHLDLLGKANQAVERKGDSSEVPYNKH